MRRALMLFPVLVLVVVVCAQWIDRPVMYYFLALKASPETAWVRQYAALVGRAGQPEAWLVLFGLLLLWRLIRNRAHIWQSLPVHALSAIIISTVLVRLGKLITSRTRPSDLIEGGAYGFHWSFDKSLNAFPSGHSSLIAAIMLVLAHHFPRWRYLCYAVAFAVAASRVVQLKHFVSDSLMGLYVGALSAIIALSWRRLSDGQHANNART